MRRTVAAAALALGMLAAAACGGGGDDDGDSTEAICGRLEETVTPLEAELGTAMSNAALAANQGDDAALAEARAKLDELVGQITGAVRQGAEDASDEEFRTALHTFADELENLAAGLQAGEVLDTGAFEAARTGVSQHCDQ
jgi:ABC-type transporter Mla subunit MlaD